MTGLRVGSRVLLHACPRQHSERGFVRNRPSFLRKCPCLTRPPPWSGKEQQGAMDTESRHRETGCRTHRRTRNKANPEHTNENPEQKPRSVRCFQKHGVSWRGDYKDEGVFAGPQGRAWKAAVLSSFSFSQGECEREFVLSVCAVKDTTRVLCFAFPRRYAPLPPQQCQNSS